MADSSDNAGVRFPPPLMFLGMLVLGIAFDRFLPMHYIKLSSFAAALIAGVFALGGILFLVGSIGLFAKAGNNPEPWKPVDKFIAEGIYLRTRNPMYLGMAMIYLALAIAFQSVGAFILFLPLLWMIGHFVIAREEGYLERQFGETYIEYKSKVRRWL